MSSSRMQGQIGQEDEMKFVKKNAKAIVAVGVIGVAAVGSALGVETGIDVEQWWGVLGIAVLGGAVWGVPNSDEE